ncbi:MAG: M42 family peptidase [Candidatus Coatesbacteria bacterium]|nr:M42 family peptidase [Candidatus Coatesbacteria bacterium]
MEKKYLKIFKEFGPSGDEENISNYLKELMKSFADKCYNDVLGNLICVKKSNSKNARNIMLAAHMDQIGFIVTHIDKKGYLRFHSVGGHYPYNQVTQRVIFKNGIKGMICYDNEECLPKLKIDNLYVDIGAKNKEAAEKHIKIGDRFVWDTEPFEQFGNLCSMALDDRIGCLILILLAERLKAAKHNIYYVFTVQEEVGVRGAKTSAFAIEPDLGIALDVTGSDDAPGNQTKCSVSCAMGKGTGIKIMDSGIIVPKQIVDWEISLAEKHKIPYQREVLTGGATDSFAIHLTKKGILASTLSVPTRHVHSSSEICSIADVEATVKLLKVICESEKLPV